MRYKSNHYIMYTWKIDGVLFARVFKSTGTIYPHVQNNGVLFDRQCKNARYHFARVLFVRDSHKLKHSKKRSFQ